MLLAKLLLEKPDILLLDEPTNYLDEEHIAWLKRYLLDYENAFILISHDIPFLNEVVNIIYHMENQELNRYVGDYDHFQEVYAVSYTHLDVYKRQLIKYIADEDKLEKVLENPQVIKTPVVRNGKQSTLGYQPDVWKTWK